MDKKKSPSWSYKASQKHGKMYGMLLESIQHFVSTKYGEVVWNKILEHAGLKNMVFTTHRIYTNETMLQLARSCCHVTNSETSEEWMCFFGKCFVKFCSHYGYDKLLRIAGRQYCDFLNGIDNIHEMIRFSYPHLQSPSFMVTSEDTEGCVLLYQSKRQGFKQYVIGQLQQCAKRFYNVQVKISIIEETVEESLCTVTFRLDFDNFVFRERNMARKTSGSCPFSRISCDTFLTVAPFCIIFDNHLQIKKIGKSMAGLLKGERLLGENLHEKFHLRRPLIPFVWDKILAFQRVMFELEYYHDNNTSNKYACIYNRNNSPSDLDHGSSGSPTKGHHITNDPVILRGQMKYMSEWQMVAFLCTPLLGNLEGLRTVGLYINDLNMYDNSRDMVMAGWQHVSTLECSIEQQKGKSDQIAENLQMAEQWNEKSDSLLYSMIPQSIAERLKHDEDPIKTCEVFDNVTILFNYMVGFSEICASATPLKIVECINSVLVLFDNIVDKYNVFKVETLGDAVYMIAGGVPDRSPKHAENVAALALEFQETAAVKRNFLLKDKVTTRIGMHTGSVVGGVVGRRMPQYCLFGDTVNTASRMQTYSMPGRIHISETCNECLQGTDFVTVFRGTVNVKGKGEMRTYWLAGRAGEETTRKFCEDVKHENSIIMERKARQHSSYDLHGMHVSSSYGIFTDFKKRDSLQDVCQGARPVDDTGSQDDSSESSGFVIDVTNTFVPDKGDSVSFEIGSARSSIKGSSTSLEIESPRLAVTEVDIFESGSPKTSQMSDATFDIGSTTTSQVNESVSFEVGSPKADFSFKIGSPKNTAIHVDDSFESNNPNEMDHVCEDYLESNNRNEMDKVCEPFFNTVTPEINDVSGVVCAVDNLELDTTEDAESYEICSSQLTSPDDIEDDTIGLFLDVGSDPEFELVTEESTSCLNEADITVEIQNQNTTWELHKGIHHVELDMKEFEPPIMEHHPPHVLGNLCPLPHTHYSRMPAIEELTNAADETKADERKSSMDYTRQPNYMNPIDGTPKQALSTAEKTVNSVVTKRHQSSTNNKYMQSVKAVDEKQEQALSTKRAIEELDNLIRDELVALERKSAIHDQSSHTSVKSDGIMRDQAVYTTTDQFEKDKAINDRPIENKHTVQSSAMCPCGNVDERNTLRNNTIEFTPAKACQCIQEEQLRETNINHNKTTYPFTKSASALSSLTNGAIYKTSEINGTGKAVGKPPPNNVATEQWNGHNEEEESCPVAEDLGQDLSMKMRDWQGRGLQFRLSMTDELNDS